jgi:hypothetical protein
VEGAGEGVASYDDEHYKTWPEPWTEFDEAEGWYLKSMTPLEELASFLATRGDCLTDNGRLGEAVQAYAWASAVAPDDKRYQQILSFTHHKHLAQHERETELLLEMNRRNRERQQRMLAGTTAGGPPSGIPSVMPMSGSARPPKPTFHEAMTRYNRELMELVMVPVVSPAAVNRHDVRVMQPGRESRLALEPLDLLGLQQCRGGQDLERDVPA